MRRCAAAGSFNHKPPQSCCFGFGFFFARLNQTYRQLLNDNELLTTDHKQLKSQLNEVKLEHTWLEADFNKLKKEFQQLDISYTKLRNQCEVLRQGRCIYMDVLHFHGDEQNSTSA